MDNSANVDLSSVAAKQTKLVLMRRLHMTLVIALIALVALLTLLVPSPAQVFRRKLLWYR